MTLAEPVHLHQQLVEGLLAFVVTATQTGAALTTDGIDLIDENDARRVLLGLLEQIANPGCADADEHLDEVRAGDGEKGHPGLACDGAGQQRLTGSGRAVEQHALGDFRAKGLIAPGVLQEVFDLVELFDRLVGAGDVGEGGLRHVLGQQLGLRLAESEAHPATGLHPGEHDEQRHQKKQRQHVDQQCAQDTRLVDGGIGLDAFGGQRVKQRHGVTGRVLRQHLGGVARLAVAALQFQPDLLFAVVDLGRRDVVSVDLGHRHRGVHRLEAAGVVGEVEEHPPQEKDGGDHRQGADNVFAIHQAFGPRGAPVLP